MRDSIHAVPQGEQNGRAGCPVCFRGCGLLCVCVLPSDVYIRNDRGFLEGSGVLCVCGWDLLNQTKKKRRRVGSWK